MADLDLSGRRLGDFVLRERIGQGGYGAVYRCDQPLLHRHAVIKVLHQRLREDDIALQRFMREAQLASLLDHPYAAHIYSFGVEGDDGLPWIAMELVQGVTLNRWLELRGPMPLDQFVPFFECMAQVVQVAHERGIIHRDLKPSNVMVIERAGRLFPKLLDFGIAKLLSDVAPPQPLGAGAHDPGRTIVHGTIGDGVVTERIRATPAGRVHRGRLGSVPPMPAMPARPDRNRITHSDTGIGSPAYMSPEQWSNAFTVGPPADLYALGVVAHEALIGRLPFAGVTNEEYYYQHCNAAVPPLGEPFSAGLYEVFQRALAKRPEDRYGDALALAAALRSELRAQPREQVRVAAQQWLDRGRPSSLLWHRDVLADIERRWPALPTAVVLSEPDASFLVASRQFARRASRNRRLFAVLGVAAALGGIEYRAALQTRMAELKASTAEQLVTQAEVEQGRQALLHDELADARTHLTEAYRRGDRSASTAFMLARAAQPTTSELARFSATKGRMWSAAFSPDGQQIVTTDDGAAQLWDAHTQKRLHTLPHGATVYHAVYSSDGTRVVTACDDGSVRIWNAIDGSLVTKLTWAPPGTAGLGYLVVAMSPDDKLVAAMDMNGAVAHVWDAHTGAAVAAVANVGREYPSIAFSADGRWLATGGGDDVRVVNTKTWRIAMMLPGPHIRKLRFDPTGPRLITGSTDGDAAIWSIPSGVRLHHMREIGEPIDQVAFSPSGEFVAMASRDGTEQIWNAMSGAPVSKIHYLKEKVMTMEFDPTSRLVLAAGAEGTVVILDVALGMPVSVLEGPKGRIRAAHFDPRSQRVVGASLDGTARIWNATPPYRRWGSPAISDGCGVDTSLEPDHRFIAVSCGDHATQIWDTAHDQLVAELPSVTPAHGDFATALPAVSADGARAAISRDRSVEIYELPAGRLVRTIGHSAAVSAVAFAPAGHDIVTGGIDGSLRISRDDDAVLELPASPAAIDAAALLGDGRVVVAAGKQLRIHAPVSSGPRAQVVELVLATRVGLLRPTSDNHRLVTVPRAFEAIAAPVLWDLERPRAIANLDAHTGRVLSARFVDGDRQIVTAGSDGTARRWDGATGQLHQTYLGSARYLGDATLSPDGAMILAGGGDGVLRFWDAASGRPLWTFLAHKSPVLGIHFESRNIITRGSAGEVTRWELRKPEE